MGTKRSCDLRGRVAEKVGILMIFDRHAVRNANTTGK